MSRAGWPLGMLSFSKLYVSHSTSGPSTTLNPMDAKELQMSRTMRVVGCRPPLGTGQPGRVTSMASPAMPAAASACLICCSRSSRPCSRATLAAFAAAPAARRSSAGSEPRPRSTCVSSPRLPKNATRHASSCSVSDATFSSRSAFDCRSSTWSVVLASLMCDLCDG